MRQNPIGTDVTILSDGWQMGGGTTERTLQVTGSNISLWGNGSATLTFPNATTTIPGTTIANTFTAIQMISGSILQLTNLQNQKTLPTPSTNTISFGTVAKANRQVLSFVTPDGRFGSVGEEVFTSVWSSATVGSTTTPVYQGPFITPVAVGTVSHVVSETLGYMANQVTAGTANAFAGVAENIPSWYIGSQTGKNGFFYAARFAFPDSAYVSLRAFSGFASLILTGSVQFDTPVGTDQYVGFQFCSGSGTNGNLNWRFITKATQVATGSVDTGISFAASSNVFRTYIYCPPYPSNSTVYWQIENETAGTMSSGSIATNLPTGSVALKAGLIMSNVAATARNIRWSEIYVSLP